MKAKKKKKMMGRSKQQAHIEGDPDRLGLTVAGEMQGAGSKPQKKKKKKNQKQKKTPRKAAAEEMYPTDENLFLIKQRKRRK